MPAYEARSLLASDQSKTTRIQSLKGILDALAKGKDVVPASSDQLKAIPSEPESSDTLNNASIVLCCSLSLSDSSSRKQALKKLAAYLPSLNLEVMESNIKKAVKKAISLAVTANVSYSKITKALKSTLVDCSKDGPFLALRAFSALINMGDPLVFGISYLWQAIGDILSNSLNAKLEINASTRTKLLTQILPRTLEWFGSVSLSGASSRYAEFESYLQVVRIILTRGAFESLADTSYSTLFTVTMLFNHSANTAEQELYVSITKLLMDGMVSFKPLRDALLSQINEYRNNEHDQSAWMVEQEIDAKLLAWNLLTRSLQYVAFGTQLDANKWMKTIFDMLPERWPIIQKTISYDSLLQKIAETAFKLILDPRGSSKPGALTSVTSVCQSHLYSPHPLVHHISLDLWCLIIRCSSGPASSTIAPSLGDLAKHFVRTHFPKTTSTTMTLEGLVAINHTRIRTSSIIRRVMESLQMYHRPEIDSRLKDFPVMFILDGNRGEMSEADFLLIDILPWDLMSNTSLLWTVIDQISGMIQGPHSLRPEPSVRLLLGLRAIYRILQDFGVNLQIEALSSITKAVTATLTSIKNSTSPTTLDADTLCTIVDILSSLRALSRSNWKTPFLNLSSKLATFPSSVKVAMLQFIAACFSDTKTSDEDISSIKSSVNGALELLISDSDWSVASEAAISYFVCCRHRPTAITKISSANAIIGSYSTESAADPTPDSVLQMLRAACSESSNRSLLDSLISFKMDLSRFASTSQVQNNRTILQELARVHQRLTQLEGALAVPDASSSPIVL